MIEKCLETVEKVSYHALFRGNSPQLRDVKLPYSFYKEGATLLIETMVASWVDILH